MESWRRYKKSLLKEQDMSSYEPAMSLPEEEDEQTMSLPPEEPSMSMEPSKPSTAAAAPDFSASTGAEMAQDMSLPDGGGEAGLSIDPQDLGVDPATVSSMEDAQPGDEDFMGPVAPPAQQRYLQRKARKQRRFFKDLRQLKRMLTKAGFNAGSGSGYTAQFANAVLRAQKKLFPFDKSQHDAIVGPKTFKALKAFGSTAKRRKYLKPETDSRGRTLDDDGKPIDIFDLNEAKKKSPHNDIKLISESWSRFLTEETTKEEEEAGMSLPSTGQMSMTPDPNAPNMSMPKPTIMDKVKAAGQKAVDDFNTPMSGDDNQQALAKTPLVGDLAAQQYGKAKAAAHASGLAGPKPGPQPPKPAPKPKPNRKKGLTGWRAAKATQLRVLRKTFKNKQSVSSVQKALVKAGKKYENILSGNGKGKAVDNDYGRRTYNAIAAFQRDYIAKNGKGSLGNYGAGGVDGVVGGRTLEALVKAAPKTELAKAHTSAPGGVTVKGKESDIKAADKLAKAKGKAAKGKAAEAAAETSAIEKAAGSAVVRQGKAAKAIFTKNGLKYPEIKGRPGAARTADVEKAADAAVKAGKMSTKDRKELNTVIKGAGAAEALEKQQSGLRVKKFKEALQKQIGKVEQGSREAKRLKKAMAGAKSYSRLRGMSNLSDMVKATAAWIRGKADDPIESSLVDKSFTLQSIKPDADALYDAMSGAGTDEQAIFKILKKYARENRKIKLPKSGKIIRADDALSRVYGRREDMNLFQWLADELDKDDFIKAIGITSFGRSPRSLLKIFRQMNS